MEILKFGFRGFDSLTGGLEGEKNRLDFIAFQHGALEILHLVCRHGDVGNGKFAEGIQGQNALHGVVKIKSIVAVGMEHLFFIFFIRGSAEFSILLKRRKRAEELPDLLTGDLHSELSGNRQARGDFKSGLFCRFPEHPHIRFHIVLNRHHQRDILHRVHQFSARDILIERLADNRVRRHRIAAEQDVSARTRRKKPDERNNDDASEQTKQDTAVLHKHIVHFCDDHECSFSMLISYFFLKIQVYPII